MRFSPLTEAIAVETADAWAVHGRAAERKRCGDDVILLSIGDPDFDTPTPITDAAIEALRAGDTHYTPSSGTRACREAAAAHHRRTTGQPVTSDNVLIVPGAQCGLFCAVLCTLGSGDEVIVPEPMYVTYEGVAGAAGAVIVPVRLRPENGFHVDAADIATAITPRSRAILINTPHNPTGTVMRRPTIETLDHVSREHDLWVIVDEVYSHLTFERPHISPGSVGTLAQRTISVHSLSKSHAMTGWRIGWMVGPPALIAQAENLLSSMLYGSPGFIQAAAALALSRDLPETKQMRAHYRARRDLVCDRLAAIELVSCHRPESGMYVMIDIRRTGMTGQDFANRLLDATGVSLLPGEGFGRSGAGHVRLSLCAPHATLLEACARIERFLSRQNLDEQAQRVEPFRRDP